MPFSTSKAIFGLPYQPYVPSFITSTTLPYAPLPRHADHALIRICFAFVVYRILSYNFLEASCSMPLNFYELPEVSPASDGGKIQVGTTRICAEISSGLC